MRFEPLQTLLQAESGQNPSRIWATHLQHTERDLDAILPPSDFPSTGALFRALWKSGDNIFKRIVRQAM